MQQSRPRHRGGLLIRCLLLGDGQLCPLRIQLVGHDVREAAVGAVWRPSLQRLKPLDRCPQPLDRRGASVAGRPTRC
eukprot:3793500-Pyramimonas_sp.AAC.1